MFSLHSIAARLRSTLFLSLCAQSTWAQEPGAVGVWDLDPEQRWRVSESLRLGGPNGEGPTAFGSVKCIAVDPMDRVWVVEGVANELRVFEADGSFVRAVGGWVEGRGGFRNIGDAFSGPGEEIWVEDLSTRRYEVFDTAGIWIRGHPLVLPGSVGGPQAWTRQGVMVVREVFTDAADTVRFYELADGALGATGRKAVSVWPECCARRPVPGTTDRAGEPGPDERTGDQGKQHLRRRNQ